MPRIEIYTQPWCPFCSRAVALLKRKGAAFEEIDAPARLGPSAAAAIAARRGAQRACRRSSSAASMSADATT